VADEDILTIGAHSFSRGERGFVELPFGRSIMHTDLCFGVHVFRGRKSGPRLLVSAGVHGDEINGVEIARRLRASKSVTRLTGDLIIVPIVNVPAFVARSRYLPDRRDLNRLFPGSAVGSHGARCAHVFMTEVASKCTHVLDLHTASNNRTNLPQVRVDFGLEGNRSFAGAFRAPVVINSSSPAGSFREALTNLGIHAAVYEAGAEMTLDMPAVRFGQRGIVNVMRYLGMLKPSSSKAGRATKAKTKTAFCKKSSWLRAPTGGIFRAQVPLGRAVSPDIAIGIVADPFSNQETPVFPDNEGIIIGRTNAPLVDEGDALFHIATHSDTEGAEQSIAASAEAVLTNAEDAPFEDSVVD
jgi:predicted deacylase